MTIIFMQLIIIENCAQIFTYIFEITIGYPFDGLTRGEDEILHGSRSLRSVILKRVDLFFDLHATILVHSEKKLFA